MTSRDGFGGAFPGRARKWATSCGAYISIMKSPAMGKNQASRDDSDVRAIYSAAPSQRVRKTAMLIRYAVSEKNRTRANVPALSSVPPDGERIFRLRRTAAKSIMALQSATPPKSGKNHGACMRMVQYTQKHKNNMETM